MNEKAGAAQSVGPRGALLSARTVFGAIKQVSEALRLLWRLLRLWSA
jgi:hypothetical protein